MNSIRNLICLSLMLTALVFFSTGCERDDDPDITVTNETTYVENGITYVVLPPVIQNGSENGNNGSNTTNSPEVKPVVIVVNDTSNVVQIVFNGELFSVEVANPFSHNYSGSSFDITLDGAPRTVTDGLNHIYTFEYDSSGNIKIRGESY